MPPPIPPMMPRSRSVRPTNRSIFCLLLVAAATLVRVTPASAQTTPASSPAADPVSQATKITGRVVSDDSHLPVAHVHISLMEEEADLISGKFHAMSGQQIAETDATGKYTFVSVAGERYVVVTLSGESDRYIEHGESRVFSHTRQTVTEPDLHVSTGALLQGTIRDAVSGAPLPHAWVSTHDNSTATGKDGTYRLCVIPGDRIEVTAERPWPSGGIITTFDAFPKMDTITQTVDARSGQTVTLDLSIPYHTDKVIFRGTVTDGKGKPLAGIRVGAVEDDNTLAEKDFRVYDRDGLKSDATGHWVTSECWRDGRYHIGVGAGWELISPAPSEHPVKLTEGQNVTIAVRRVPTLTVQGRVVTLTGAPVPNAKLFVNVTGKTEFDSTLLEVHTDSAGKYVVGPLDLKDAVAMQGVTKEGFRLDSLCASLKVPASVSTETTIEANDITMTALSRTIHGQVRDANGKPVAGARVWSTESGSLDAATKTDASGAFEIANVPELSQKDALPFRITAAEGRSFGQVTLAPGADNTDAIVSLHTPGAPRASDSECAHVLADSVSAARNPMADSFLEMFATFDPDAALRSAAISSDYDAPERIGHVLAAVARHRSHDPAIEFWLQTHIAPLQAPRQRSVAEAEAGLALAGTQPAVAARFLQASQTDAPQGTRQQDEADAIRRNALRYALGLLSIPAVPTSQNQSSLPESFREPVEKYEREDSLLQFVRFLGRSSAMPAPDAIETLAKTTLRYNERTLLYKHLAFLWVDDTPALASYYLKLWRAIVDAEPEQLAGHDRKEQYELTTRIAVATAPVDFDTALARLQDIPEEVRMLPLARVAHAADIAGVHARESAVAWQKVRDHFATQHSNTLEELMWLANLALPHSPELSVTFFREAQQTYESPKYPKWTSFSVEFTCSVAAFDPALARELAATAFSKARNQSELGSLYAEMSQAALAMSAVDRDQGLAMMDETLQLAQKHSPYSVDNVYRSQFLLTKRLLIPLAERPCDPPEWLSLLALDPW